VKTNNISLIGDFNPSEKYDSQIGSSSQFLGNIKAMFQTTNQVINHSLITITHNHPNK